jgi:hypothetical protein
MDVLELLKAHGAEIKNRFAVKRLGVFGSHARGEQKATSDIDILVEFETPTYENFISLIYFLEDLTGKTVDLVTSRGLSPYLRSAVTEEVIWCE